MTRAEFLVSPLLKSAGFRHAFFTRGGGVSRPPFASLSFSVSVGDDPEHVRENLRRASEALELPSPLVFFASQVHGTTTLRVDGSSSPEEVMKREADAIVSGVPSLACAVRTADCVPLLIGDRRSGAVGAVHAGWRGVELGVIESAVGALRELLAGPGDLVAAVGPHISLGAFEVGEDVAARLAAVSPDPDVVDRSFGPKPHVDLRRIVRAKLGALGLEPSAIDDVGGCTVLEPERFFSFRRDGARSGRHLSAIVARR